MADNYDKTLELFKKLQQSGATDTLTPPPQQTQTHRQNPMMGDVESLNEAVFGRYNPETDTSTSNGQKVLMETMKQFESGNISEETRQRVRENVRNLKIPAAILHSMIDNPLFETKIDGTDVDSYMDNLMQKNKNIQASKRINEKLEGVDNSRVSQTAVSQKSFSEIDYNKLQQVIEETIDRKLSQYIGKINLNENKQQTASPNLHFIMEKNQKFIFVDSSDNIFECNLVYKGKNRKK